jgi:antitoxin HigA-1
MTLDRNFRASGPMHPGEIVRRRFFARLEVKQASFCRQYGFNDTLISRLFSGKTRITADTAKKLSEVFGMSPMFFMNLQSQYDLAMHGGVTPDIRDEPNGGQQQAS